jgi:preprotein translocase subunit SecE
MAMNRETKRMMQRQGQLGPDGEPVRAQRKPPSQPSSREREQRTSPGQFLKEVRGELRKVAWPTRPEIVNYSIIVLVAVVVLTAFIAGLDWVFSNFVLDIFE